MKVYIKIILTLLLLNLLSSENLINKKLNYKIEFRGLDAGVAYLKLEEDTLFSKSVLRLNSELKTNKFIDFFYKIRDDITVYLDSSNLSLLKVINKINEGPYKKNHWAIFDIDTKNIITKKKHIEIDKAYSPLSIIYSLRKELLNINDTYKYDIYSLGKIKKIVMKVLNKETIRTSFGEFDTIVVSPISNENLSVIKNNGDMRIWFTDDQNKYPIKIELKINYGKLVLLLNTVE